MIQELFEDLGGKTQELLIDNPKALVINNNPFSEDEVMYNPHALLLAAHLGTELKDDYNLTVYSSEHEPSVIQSKKGEFMTTFTL